MYRCVVVISKAIEKRFPGTDFLISNTAFLDPTTRNLVQPDVLALVNRFSNGRNPFNFAEDGLKMQFRMYQNDATIDLQYSLSNKEVVRFWCELYRGTNNSVLLRAYTCTSLYQDSFLKPSIEVGQSCETHVRTLDNTGSLPVSRRILLAVMGELSSCSRAKTTFPGFLLRNCFPEW